ncbi:retrovirus-related Pol polyprotein from transposon 297 [Nephila pilipes]|uniref:Retrovirus-related Pol polyprotein from transposon 297 n=1 Tax=Nephila pilipes TaxID=299642 RepID=A0A8X6Q340_NEPPI|nr:retrovirus-related Pol polyprotein from transposon 297 [Nephila pilipes]
MMKLKQKLLNGKESLEDEEFVRYVLASILLKTVKQMKTIEETESNIFCSGKYQPDPEKIKTIQKLEITLTKKIKSLPGLLNRNRYYILKYAEIAHPLTELKERAPEIFDRTKTHQRVVYKLKGKLKKTPELCFPIAREAFHHPFQWLSNSPNAVIPNQITFSIVGSYNLVHLITVSKDRIPDLERIFL